MLKHIKVCMYYSINIICISYVRSAYSIQSRTVLCSPKYCIIKLPMAGYTFGNNFKITSFPVWIYKWTVVF